MIRAPILSAVAAALLLGLAAAAPAAAEDAAPELVNARRVAARPSRVSSTTIAPWACPRART